MLSMEKNDKSETLFQFAEANNLSTDDVLGLYVLLGDTLFFLFSLMQGKVLKIPLKRKLSSFGKSEKLHLVECEGKPKSEYIVDGKTFVPIGDRKKILNHFYVPVKEEPGEGND